MLASLGKAQDRLEFLQETHNTEKDDEMVVVCHNVQHLYKQIFKTGLIFYHVSYYFTKRLNMPNV